MEGMLALVSSQFAVIDLSRAGRVHITEKFDESAKGQCCDLPDRAVLVGPRPQHLAETNRIDLSPDPTPTAHHQVAKLMNCHNN